MAAMLVLIGLQYSLSIAVRHFPMLRQIISSEPAILFHQGQYIETSMRKERIAKEEIKAAMHEKGISNVGMVEAVILGSNGDSCVVLKPLDATPASVTLASSPEGGKV